MITKSAFAEAKSSATKSKSTHAHHAPTGSRGSGVLVVSGVSRAAGTEGARRGILDAAHAAVRDRGFRIANTVYNGQRGVSWQAKLDEVIRRGRVEKIIIAHPEAAMIPELMVDGSSLSERYDLPIELIPLPGALFSPEPPTMPHGSDVQSNASEQSRPADELPWRSLLNTVNLGAASGDNPAVQSATPIPYLSPFPATTEHLPRGRKPWLRVNFGYEPSEQRLDVNVGEAIIVHQIFSWVGYDGWSPYRVVNHLNGVGIPSPGEREWSIATLVGSGDRPGGMLRNRIYLGQQAADTESWVVPPIISSETWDRVQQALAMFDAGKEPRKPPKTSKRGTGNRWLSGRIFFKGCTRSLTILPSSSSRRRVGRPNPCRDCKCEMAHYLSRSFDLGLIESHALLTLQDALRSPETGPLAAAILDASEERKKQRVQYDGLQARLLELMKHFATILSVGGVLKEPASGISNLRSDIDRTVRQIREMGNPHGHLKLDGGRGRDALCWIDAMSVEPTQRPQADALALQNILRRIDLIPLRDGSTSLSLQVNLSWLLGPGRERQSSIPMATLRSAPLRLETARRPRWDTSQPGSARLKSTAAALSRAQQTTIDLR